MCPMHRHGKHDERAYLWLCRDREVYSYCIGGWWCQNKFRRNCRRAVPGRAVKIALGGDVPEANIAKHFGRGLGDVQKRVPSAFELDCGSLVARMVSDLLLQSADGIRLESSLEFRGLRRGGNRRGDCRWVGQRPRSRNYTGPNDIYIPTNRSTIRRSLLLGNLETKPSPL